MTRVITVLYLLAVSTAHVPGQPCGVNDPYCNARTRAPQDFHGLIPEKYEARPQGTAVSGQVAGAICQVRNWVSPHMHFNGTGTLIAKGNGRGLVVTCAHTFYDTDKTAGRAVVVLRSGRYIATVLGHDPQLDVLMLEIIEPPEEPLALASTAPVAGDSVYSMGYQENRLCCSPGQTLSYAMRIGNDGIAGPANATLVVSGTVVEGCSGGPILDRSFKVCGVLFGTNRKGRVDGVALPRLRAFFQRWAARVQFRRQQAPVLARGRAQPQRQPAPPAPQPGEWRPGNADPSIYANRDAANQLERAADELRQTREDLVRQRIAQNEAARAASEQPPPMREVAVQEIPPEVEKVASKGVKYGVTRLLLMVGLPALPAAITAGILTWLLMRRARKRVPQLAAKVRAGRRRSRAVPPDPVLPPHVVDEYHHTQVVEVPDNTKDKCWARACAIFVGKYPGTKETVRGIQALKDQLLKGQPHDEEGV